ncbi:MAG: lytic transglycosylase domain-containing protein [Pseudothermotoga sp.]
MKALFFVFILLVIFFFYLYFPLKYYSVVRENSGSIDPLLIMALIKVESNFREKAVSHAGAIGLMQILPSTAAWICQRSGFSRDVDITSPVDNIVVGIEYLRYLIDLYEGNIELALRAYNSGPSRVANRSDVAGEYLSRVKLFHRIYRILYFWVR